MSNNKTYHITTVVKSMMDTIPEPLPDGYYKLKNIFETLSYQAPEIAVTFWKKIYLVCMEHFTDMNIEWQVKMSQIYSLGLEEYSKKFPEDSS